MRFFPMTDKELRLREPTSPMAGAGSGVLPPGQMPGPGPGRRARTSVSARDQAGLESTGRTGLQDPPRSELHLQGRL